MDVITMDRLVLGSVFDIPQILNLEISQEINEHGRLVLCGGLKEDEKPAEAIRAEGTQLKLGYREADGRLHDAPLFDGLIERVHIFREGGLSRVILSAVSGSWLLDQEERSRSFQNVGMDYAGVVDQVVAGVGGAAICSEGEGVSIGKPLIQYRETDWSFLRRLASHFHSYLVPDITSAKPCLWFGMRKGNGEAGFLEPKVDTGLDKRYYEIDGEGAGIPKATFLYRMVEDMGDFKIGDLTPELGAGFRICGKKVQSKGGILLFTYRSGRPEGLSTQMAYNEQFTGLSLSGTVSGTDKETVRVSLDIDGGEGSYPYPWAPPTGNIMYCMPKPGTKASLYFRSHDEREGQATNSPRNNGGTCSGMSDPGKRTLTTEHGKQLNLFTDCMSMIGSGDGVNPLQLMMPDAGSMVFQSHSKFEMVSQEGIRLEAPQVAFHTPQEISACRTSVHVPLKGAMIRPKGTGKNPPTGGGDTSFTMNYEFNSLGAKGVLCGWEFTTYEPFQDAPEEVAVPKEKSSYAGLWGNILAGLILVTVAAVAVAYVAATVFTAGAAATVAPLVIGGLAGIAGAAMVMASADRDVANNENSGPIAYMFNGAVGVLTGAVLGTAIILSPFAAEVAVATNAPAGMGMFGKYINPATLTKFASVGFYAVSSVNALFKTLEAQEKISGENLLKEKMPEGVYDDLSGMAALGTATIVVMGLMNPNYMSGPKEAAGDITKKANSVEEKFGPQRKNPSPQITGTEFNKGGSRTGEGGSGAEGLDDTRKFADDVLENNYQKYVERNQKAGKPVRDRTDWKEASDYWTKESPIARGNKFNQTVRDSDTYPYHEVHLSNGKQLDSYDPVSGEIISRKATDLDKISEKTYRNYLSEIKEKYSAGTTIRSDKYPDLDGLKLDGDYILEVPASNADLGNIKYYEDIAEEYGVKLRFTEEIQ